MAVSDVLKGFRKDDYKGKEKEEKSDSPGPRMIKLTDDEAKELQGYQKGPGMEQDCLVTGRLGEGGEFTVTSVRSPEGGAPDPDGMASELMNKMRGGMPPVMQNQTMPSPS
jgi:hypothetical protein